MAVRIKSVDEGSPCFDLGIRADDTLISINGQDINDVLDYMFYSPDIYDSNYDNAEVLILRDGAKHNYSLKAGGKDYDGGLGLAFDSFLMDKKQSCKNNCVFCFIDQNPPGMRDTIYFKDDDARLSFLQGNYITLSGLEDCDVDRIIKMRLSVNISVHTTNPALRQKMMNNRFAGEKLKYLKQLCDAGIKINCQLVLCPGLNDGHELEKTLADLGELYPGVVSIAVVPVGLTGHRSGLYPLSAFDEKSAENVLTTVNKYQKQFLTKYKTRLVFAADEFFLKAGLPLPRDKFYEDYPQFDNGVGMVRSFTDEFVMALKKAKKHKSTNNVSVATGSSAYDFICELTRFFCKKFGGDIHVYRIENDFFGNSVTVAGLLTGGDIIKQLKGKILGTRLFLSEAMLKKEYSGCNSCNREKYEYLFLDDYTIEDIEKNLGVKITPVKNSGKDFFEKLAKGANKN